MIVIVDYHMGNIRSVAKAFKRIGAEFRVSKNPNDIKNASHLVLPGVGAFPDGIHNLKTLGLKDILDEEVLVGKKPFLGICLGMQLLGTYGEEHGGSDGLGWIQGIVRRFNVDETQYKIPHVGWDDVLIVRESPLFNNLSTSSLSFYFVHSYHFIPDDQRLTVGSCIYGEPFTAVVQRDNIFGVQFHPEKSQSDGIKVIQNFVEYSYA